MRVLAALVGAVLLVGCATVPAEQGPPLQVSEVIAVEGRTAAQLCNAARDWTATAFRSSKAVVEVFDPQRGKLIGKGNMAVPIIYGMTIPVHFTMTVDCKDGRVRAVFNDYGVVGGGPLVEDENYKLKTKAAARTKEMIEDLRQQLAAKAKDDF